MTHKHKRKTGRFTARSASPHQAGTWWEDRFVAALHEAEQHAIPMLHEAEVEDAGGALLLLARWVQVVLTGHPYHPPESMNAFAERVLEVWQQGLYLPSPAYPYTLQESIQGLRNDPPPVRDYAEWFQPFTPTKPTRSCGLGAIACGLFKHPKTGLWQVWLNLDGPCRYLGAYQDATDAQRILEGFILIARRYRFSNVELMEIVQEVNLQGEGEIQNISYHMLAYLLSHLKRYIIVL